jgi:hypothetical protein
MVFVQTKKQAHRIHVLLGLLGIKVCILLFDYLCGLMVRVPGYRSRGPGSIPSTIRFSEKVVGLDRGPLSLVTTTEELLERKK